MERERGAQRKKEMFKDVLEDSVVVKGSKVSLLGNCVSTRSSLLPAKTIEQHSVRYARKPQPKYIIAVAYVFALCTRSSGKKS